MQNIPLTIASLDVLSAHEIAELWIKLTNAAGSDEDAKAFLLMFEPWAKERLGPMS
jgi:hypothetical protein